MQLFKDQKEIDKIKEERDDLIKSLDSFNIGEDEKRFIVRRICILSDKLIEKANYSGSIK